MRKTLQCNLTKELQRRLPLASKPQVQNLALLTQALVYSKDCHLANLALELPLAGMPQQLYAQHPVQNRPNTGFGSRSRRRQAPTAQDLRWESQFLARRVANAVSKPSSNRVIYCPKGYELNHYPEIQQYGLITRRL